MQIIVIRHQMMSGKIINSYEFNIFENVEFNRDYWYMPPKNFMVYAKDLVAKWNCQQPDKWHYTFKE